MDVSSVEAAATYPVQSPDRLQSPAPAEESAEAQPAAEESAEGAGQVIDLLA